MKPPSKPKKILAISSGGGHWTQLRRIQRAFEGHDVCWATVMIAGGQEPPSRGEGRSFPIPDATRWNKLGLIRLFLRVLYLILRIRPDVIISTGAAPGYFAVIIGRVFRIRTCWIDSIANVEELSLSGKKARKWANLSLTQWPHLHEEGGPEYHGSVVPQLFPDDGGRPEESTPTERGKRSAGGEPRKKNIKVMAISSGGGHWVELLRLRSVLERFEVHWVTVRKEYQSDIRSDEDSFHTINDATRWNKLGLTLLALRIAWILIRVRPKVIITTGAAPGYLAVMIGSMLRIRTCWIDSLANVEELSLSGKKSGRWADLWLTQWQDLAKEAGPRFDGMLFPDLDPRNMETNENPAGTDRSPA